MRQLRTSGKTMLPTRFATDRRMLQVNEMWSRQWQIYGSETAKLWVK
jgi:hypothetical protein